MILNVAIVCLLSVSPCLKLTGRPLCDTQWSNISSGYHNDVKLQTSCPRWWRLQDWRRKVFSISSARMVLQAPPRELWRANKACRQLIALNRGMASRCLKGSISSQLVQGDKELHQCPLDNHILSQDIDSSTSRPRLSQQWLTQQEKRMTTVMRHMTLIVAILSLQSLALGMFYAQKLDKRATQSHFLSLLSWAVLCSNSYGLIIGETACGIGLCACFFF